MTTPQDLDENLRTHLAALAAPPVTRRDPENPVRDGATLTGELARQIFEAQVTSRHLDLAAHWLRSFDSGFLITGSAGHEGNAAVAAALRPNDPVLLHYRSGAFYCARAATTGGPDAIRDTLRGLTASADDPVTGGRYMVFGNPALHAIPTSATPPASHLPRAVGIGYALGKGRPVQVAGQPDDWPPDAVVACSFGDASANRAAATAAFNAAGWLDRAGLRLPVLFVCEDNSGSPSPGSPGNGVAPVGVGLGGRAPSPGGWVADTLRFRPGLHYFAADGLDIGSTFDTASRAVAWVRKYRRPAVLHLSMVNLLALLTRPGAAQPPGGQLDCDPIIASARLLVDAGLATPQELLARYNEIGWRVRSIADEVIQERRLDSVAEIIATLAPRHPANVAREITAAGLRAADPALVAGDPPVGPPVTAALSPADPPVPGANRPAAGSNRPAAGSNLPDATQRAKLFGGTLPEESGPLTLAQTMNAALTDALLAYPQMIVFGEDVTSPAGGPAVTSGLRERFGPTRVFDTVPDETSIVGLGLGAGVAGLLPVIELRCLAHLHEAEGQLRGEAATTQFFSRGAYRNPLILRLPGLGYEAGPAGCLRNDNALAVLRDIPGLVVAVPARAEDAAPLLRTCLAAGQVDGTVTAFIEPVALYHTEDLHADGDGWWRSNYAGPAAWSGLHVPIGRARTYREGEATDLTILTFGNGVPLSLRVARQLAEEEGVGTRTVDLRWLSPLPVADIVRESSATGRVLVVDETRRSGGVGEGVLAVLVDAGYEGAARRVAAVDAFVPLGPAADRILVGEEQILRGARSLLAH